MTEKSFYPKPKTRLIWSLVAAGIGLVLGLGGGDSTQQIIGWVLLGLGIAGVIYNIWVMKSGRPDQWSSP